MKKKNTVSLYEEYMSKIGDRYSIYKIITDKYQIQSAIYPGSHIDITPSFLIPKVIYVDNFSGTVKFFKESDEIIEYVNKKKEYLNACDISFINSDYYKSLDIAPVDLIISMYAGFVSQATKRYLKIGGILLANDSHGDATLAYVDKSFKLIGVISDQSGVIQYDEDALDKYFVLSKNKEVDLDQVRLKMKGPKYIHNEGIYVFEKIL